MEIKEIRLLTDLFDAYYGARSNKRNTASQLRFEMDLESNLIELYHQLSDGTYKVSPSICFMVFKPVKREVFAAQFRDRVVHHLLFNYISPLLEKTFISDSYSCRLGKGTSKGVDRLEHHIRSCTQNYTKRAYVLKLDIQGFFMGINREMLYTKIKQSLSNCIRREKMNKNEKIATLNIELVDYLLREIIFNDPTKDCMIRGKKEDWDGLPPSKSLFHSPMGVGLPIGNLTSQLFSNVLLNDLDQYIKRELCVKHYGRYVDDFYLVHPDRELLLQYKNQICVYLKEQLGLTMHPKKVHLQEVCRGINFLGVTLKPYRRYAKTSTLKRFGTVLNDIECSLKKEEDVTMPNLKEISASINSYLGYLKAFRSFKCRNKFVCKCTTINKYGKFDLTIQKFSIDKTAMAVVMV